MTYEVQGPTQYGQVWQVVDTVNGRVRSTQTTREQAERVARKLNGQEEVTHGTAQ